LLELLGPGKGERILDLGCGTGQLTADIAATGVQVVGLDSSPEMLGQARQNYPHLKFVLADATSFRFDEPFDAVFSNAALHWVKNADAAVGSIAAALRPDGRFVAEFGGKGNIASIMGALDAVFGAAAGERCPWWFPGIGEYAPLLEHHGLERVEPGIEPDDDVLVAAFRSVVTKQSYLPRMLGRLGQHRSGIAVRAEILARIE